MRLRLTDMKNKTEKVDDVCVSNRNGKIHLDSTDREIGVIDLPNLTKEELNELSETPMNKIDRLFVHDSNHQLRNEINVAFGKMQLSLDDHIKVDVKKLDMILETVHKYGFEVGLLKRDLIITVKNGSEKQVPLKSLVFDLHELTRKLRTRETVKDWFLGNKMIIWLASIVTVIVTFSLKHIIAEYWDTFF